MNSEPKLSVRCHPGNANHHLWNNNGTFWCHLTVHLPDFTKERLRISLKTRDELHARRLRDELLRRFEGTVSGEESAAWVLEGSPKPKPKYVVLADEAVTRAGHPDYAWIETPASPRRQG